MDLIEIVLVLYALLGSATLGYWLMAAFLPQFKAETRKVKLGYSLLIGAGYAVVVSGLSIALVLAKVQEMPFTEWFFVLFPIGFFIMVFAVLGKEIMQWYEQMQLQKSGNFQPAPAPSAATLRNEEELVPIKTAHANAFPVKDADNDLPDFGMEEEHFEFEAFPEHKKGAKKSGKESAAVETAPVPEVKMEKENNSDLLPPSGEKMESQLAKIHSPVKGSEEAGVEKDIDQILNKKLPEEKNRATEKELPSMFPEKKPKTTVNETVAKQKNVLTDDEIQKIKNQLKKSMENQEK